MQQFKKAYLGIGANLVPSGFNSLYDGLEAAILKLSKKITIEERSRWYRSSPVPASQQPDFLNAVLCVSGDISVKQLLTYIHEVESEFGRIRHIRNEARVLDIDILACDNQIITDSGLFVPHPRLAERAFVLMPWAEIAPQWHHPESGLTVTEMLDTLIDKNRTDQICEPFSE